MICLTQRPATSQAPSQVGGPGKEAPLPGSQEAANQLTQQIKQQLALQAKQQQQQQHQHQAQQQQQHHQVQQQQQQQAQPQQQGHQGPAPPQQAQHPAHPLHSWQLQHMRPELQNIRPELLPQHMRPDVPRQPGPGLGPIPVEARASVPGPMPGLAGNPQQVQRVSPHPPTKSPTVAQTAPNMVHGFTQHQAAAPRAPSPAVAKVG